MQTISERLKQLRLENNKTQKDVANFLKMTVRSYQRYEYGTREPPIENIKRLVIYYNVTADYLIGLSDKKN